MPSNVDQISALQQVLGKKINDRTENSFDLEDQLHATTKQIFIPDLDFGKCGIKQSNLCNELKKRYIPIVSTNKENIHKSLINPNSINMAQSVNEDHLEEPKITLWSAKNVVLGWKEKSYPPGAGFENLGNTCYLNSSIQALFHIPSFVNWLLDETSTHLPNCRNSHNLPFCSICGMMRTLRSSMEPGNSVLKPSLIHDKLKCIGKTLNYGRQEDAHEFIKLLLDHMEKSFLHFKQATRLDHRSKETTPLNQIFGGYLRQQVICPLCRYISTTFFHFQDIVLDIRSATSVEDALNLYFKKETLDSDNAYKCEQCKKRVPATKKYSIERAPHVLLLQLKRFTSGGGKIIKHVSIQKLLDLSKYVNGAMSNSPKGGGPFVYRLASMVIHIGSSQNGGHYTALAQASNSTMFVFDDSLVRPISYQNALTKNPYILFYELIDKKEQVGHKNIVARQSSEKTLINKESNSVKHLSNSYSTNFMCNGNDKKEQVGHKNIVARQSSEKTLINKESNSVKHLSNSYSTNFMCNGNGLPIQSPQKKLIDKKEQVGHKNIVARQSSEKTLINKESNSVKHLSNSYSTNFMCNGNVSTWDGGDSHMDAQTERARLSESRKRNRDDSYNEEIDRGKVRKRPKEDRPSTSRTGENPFQNFQNSFNNESSYERKKSYFPIFNSNNKNNFSDNNEHSNNRPFSKPFQNNFKSGRNYFKFNRNRFNNSHYKWNNSYSHNKHKNFNNKNNYSWFKNGGF